MVSLEKIKIFAAENFSKEKDSEQIFAEDNEFAVTNPWVDKTGRFPLNDEEAVKEWGLETVLDFCRKASEVIEKRDFPKLVGLVYKHRTDDYSVWHPDFTEAEEKEVSKFLFQYSNSGCSERDVSEKTVKEIFG